MAASLFADNYLSGPECVSFDYDHNRYLVSCWQNGRIVAIDTSGVQSPFKGGLGTAMGNVIYNNTIYVSSFTTVWGFDLETALPVFNVPISGARQLDGMAVDSSGNLYVGDFAINDPTPAQLFKINLSTENISLFASTASGLAPNPQDMLYDHANGRLIVVGYSENGPIQAVSISDSIVTNIVDSGTGNYDGIAVDNEGYYYVTNFQNGCVYRYDSDFSDPPIEFSSGHNGPANICYNKRDSILAIPWANSDTVIFIKDLYKFDSDDDGISDISDNCLNIPNPDQLDDDFDGWGNLCDNCPYNYNPGQEDADLDGIGDVCEYTCGDANADEMVNVSDAVMIINYVFVGGEAPDPIEAGDADCSGSVNVSDAVLIINFVFIGGNNPCDTSGDGQPDC
ncbi:MAG: hypothetical protein GWN14_25840 [candidate division Zixibacteria bacterium]|nr:hypothetical protein [candidate division Zixibacteria bacterium]NIW42647.1 hypothetical protein [candidate division Zixibacteria bacterium]NIX59249.1 hypothetical protein [candidate division Zixibacteria bacterium]